MPETVLDLDLIKGETFVLSLTLSDAGVPFNLTNYSVHFAIAENTGLPLVIDVDTGQPGQTVIVVVPLNGQIDITLPFTSTRFEFTKGKYSVIIRSDVNTVTYLLTGSLNVTIPAEVLV